MVGRIALFRRVVLVAVVVTGCSQDPDVGPPPTPELGDADDELRASLADLRASALALPEAGEMRGRLAMAYDINEFTQAAVTTCEQAEMLDPERFAWPYFRALLLGKMNDYPAALEAMDRAIAIDADYVPTWMWRAEWLRELGRYDEAVDAYLRAEDLGAESVAVPGRAQILLDTGNAGEAAELLEPMIEEDPHPHLFRMVGQAYRALGRQDDARIAMARGREATPIRWYDPRAAERSNYILGYSGRLRYAQDLIRSGAAREALKVIDSIGTARPEDPAYVGTLAWAYTEAGRVDEAVGLLHGALETHPDYYRFHRHLAQAYKKKGNRERLRHHLEEVVASNPADAWAHEQFGLLATQEPRRVDTTMRWRHSTRQSNRVPRIRSRYATLRR